MRFNEKGIISIIFILIIIVLVGGIAWLVLSNNNSLPTTINSILNKDPKQLSQECGVCGRQGLHNPGGLSCAPGLECIENPTTNESMIIGSFCVKPGEQYVSKCKDYYDSRVR